ncbi:MAG TPA: hypothetical protein VLI69_01760 [Gammaproteobacteria bacterium]|nr:hypothetical protein [Gammaproteobacteria bacterium]
MFFRNALLSFTANSAGQQLTKLYNQMQKNSALQKLTNYSLNLTDYSKMSSLEKQWLQKHIEHAFDAGISDKTIEVIIRHIENYQEAMDSALEKRRAADAKKDLIKYCSRISDYFVLNEGQKNFLEKQVIKTINAGVNDSEIIEAVRGIKNYPQLLDKVAETAQPLNPLQKFAQNVRANKQKLSSSSENEQAKIAVLVETRRARL